MRLATLLRDALGVDGPLAEGPEVLAIVQRHDRVAPGALFVARKGERFDAHHVLHEAVAAGAVAVVGEAALPDPLPWGGVPYLRVPDARVALAKLAAAFHGRPAEHLTVLGVTGTDGKTTTATLLHHLLVGRHPSGLVSTAAIRVGSEAVPLEGHFTTPEATEVQALLARCRDQGLSHVVLECSSHGFSLHRLDQVAFAVGVWTNLSPEHLDHHGTMAAYREAKATLMRRSRVSVLNRDEPDFAYFAAAARRVVDYGEHPDSDLRLEAVDEEGVPWCTGPHAGGPGPPLHGRRRLRTHGAGARQGADGAPARPALPAAGRGRLGRRARPGEARTAGRDGRAPRRSGLLHRGGRPVREPRQHPRGHGLGRPQRRRA
ncbi:MAG: Mur ligase family protein [Deinococcales bacterium]